MAFKRTVENYLHQWKAAYVKTQETTLKENDFWIKYLSSQLQDHESLLSVLDADKNLGQLTPASLKEAAKRYLTGKNMISFELLPEQAAK